MLYKAALHLHNLIWWIVLFSGLWAVTRTWRGKLADAVWTKREKLAGLVFSSALAMQFLAGLMLYFSSDLVHRFLTGAAGVDHMKASFFGMMHPLAMFTAVILGQVGFSVSKRMPDDRGKFRVAVFCYTAALIIVLLAVPWPFMSYGRSLIHAGH